MRPLYGLVFSVFAYLVPLGLLQWRQTFCRKTLWKWVKFIRKTCFIVTFTVILVVWSMLPDENSVSLRCFTTFNLKRDIRWNSDNSVQAVIIIGNTCILWQNNVLNINLRWSKHFKHCLAMTTLSSLVFSVFGYLGALGQLKWKHTCWNKISCKWMSEFHWENMVYPFGFPDSSWLVNVSQWE